MPVQSALPGLKVAGGETSTGKRRKRRKPSAVRLSVSAPRKKRSRRTAKPARSRSKSGKRRKAPSAKQKANWARFAKMARARAKRG